MLIYERLKLLREKLNLTTRAFGAPLNMTGGAVTNMEKGRRNITERTIKDICQTYNVNHEWFSDGIGPMFNDAVSDLPVDEDVKELARLYSLLGSDDKELVKNLLHSLSDKASSNPNEKD